MMQQQGNPATIKDQMQQGLMSEYRQQAAKEMGVGPSEMGTVARAQQGMPQGMPQQQARMPQGAPQQQMPQQPQMAQGVMSQARPVQLAGGGIVAFANGGLTPKEARARLYEDRESAIDFETPDTPLGNLLRAIGEYRPGSPEYEKRMQELRDRAQGKPPQTSTSGGTGSGVGIAASTGSAETRRNFDTSGLQAQVDAEYDRQGIVNPKYAPPPNVAQQQEEFETRRSEAQQRAEQRKKEEYESSLQGQLDAVKTSGIMSGITPYQLDEKQRTQAEGELELDADKKGLAAIKRIRTLSKMDENEKILENMRKRVQATYDETAPSRMDNLIDLFTAGGRGGITGVGVRDRQLRREEADRRRQLDQDVMGIQATTVELNRNFGADAAKAYADAEANVIAQKQNARNFLQGAEQAEVASLMDKARLTIDEQRNVRQLFTEQERNRLLAEQITATNSRALAGDISSALATLTELRTELRAEIRLRSKYSELDTLDLTDSDDVRKKKLLEGELDAEVLAEGADIEDMVSRLRARQLRLDEEQRAQQERLTPSPNIDLGEANTLVETS